MGYYTNYSLSFLNGSEEEHNAIIEEVVSITKEDSFREDGFACQIKWYSWAGDLIKISKKYPNVIIELCGDGEEAMDNWAARFLNGEMEYHEAVIPPFEKIGVNL